MHYSHSGREPTGNIKTAPPKRRQRSKATGARTGSRLWMCGVEGRYRTGARSKADSESALRRRRGGSRNRSGSGHGVGRQGCRPHWHRWMCASAVVLARCPWTSWLGSRSLRGVLDDPGRTIRRNCGCLTGAALAEPDRVQKTETNSVSPLPSLSAPQWPAPAGEAWSANPAGAFGVLFLRTGFIFRYLTDLVRY
jgi:hypothetical protein